MTVPVRGSRITMVPPLRGAGIGFVEATLRIAPVAGSRTTRTPPLARRVARCGNVMGIARRRQASALHAGAGGCGAARAGALNDTVSAMIVRAAAVLFLAVMIAEQ
jgi:hypothetical protein